MLLSDFKALGPISIPTPPTMALTEFSSADTVASVHYFIYLVTCAKPLFLTGFLMLLVETISLQQAICDFGMLSSSKES